MIDKGQHKVDTVIRAYRHAIGKFRNVVVKPGAKTWDNAIAFFDMQTTLSRPLDEIMKSAVNLYSPEWLEQTFKTPYPPFPMVVSEAARKRVARGFKPRVKSTPEQLDKQAREIASTLSTTMGTKALEMAQTWPSDPDLRELVQKYLKEAE